MTQSAKSKKTHLLSYNANENLFEELKQLGDKLGFVCTNTTSIDSFEGFLKEVWALAGILIIDDEEFASSLRSNGRKLLFVKKEVANADIVQQLDLHLSQGLPDRFVELVCNLAKSLPGKLLDVQFSGWKRSLNFGLDLNYWAICDSLAAGLVIKASCEINLARLAELSLSQGKTDQQLKDAAGEICNQVLGSINANLRKIGLNPMISLPISAELKENMGLNQWEYMPFVRLTDSKNTIAIGVLIQIDRKCTANWADLSVEMVEGAVDFF